MTDVPLAGQPDMLDKAALHFCLADTFHPGCEMTWPMRHASMFRQAVPLPSRARGHAGADYGPQLNQQIALEQNGPLYAQGPGDITRWMALPWQGDTAFCRSGYNPEYDPYLPTFWPARVPNQVLTEEDYQRVIDTSLRREERILAFHKRDNWIRFKGSVADVMLQMIAHFGAMGIVEARPGVKNDPDFPAVIYVESLAGSRLKKLALTTSRMLAAQPG